MKWLIRGGRPLKGSVQLPGDKSITHRALIIGGLASGDTHIVGGSWSDDCRSTIACLRRLGVRCESSGPDSMLVSGTGGRFAPTAELDCGNSGTTMRLMSGMLAGHTGQWRLDGDASLRSRPMARVADPLRAMGADVVTADSGRAPMTIRGGHLRGVDWLTPVASAQVKSAILLAGLGASGPTTVREPAQSRDHTERMLAAAGAELLRPDALTTILVPGRALAGFELHVPADFSASSFWIAGAAAIPGSQLEMSDVGVNPTRTGLLEVLAAMGAPIQISDRRLVGDEPVGNIVASTAPLAGCDIGGALVPRLIDELPVIAALATAANGRTTVTGAGELRVKESDRIAAMAKGLRSFGAAIEERPDGWVIDGPVRLRPASVACYGDHRVAMALAVAALMADGDSEIGGVECVATSDPRFADNLVRLGALIR